VKRVPEVGLVPDQRAVRQFGAERLDPAFGDRVHAGHPGTGQHSADLGAAEDLIDQRGVVGVAVADDEPDLGEVSGVQVHQQVADSLRNPGMGGVRGGAENTDAPASVVDGSQDVLALSGEGDGLDEVHRQDRLGLGTQQAGPRDVVGCGSGPAPSVLRISRTVEGAILMPGRASSPWMRR